MHKRIMILGAGIYQVPLIEKARQLALETIVVSPRGAYPGIDLADIYLDLDTTDVKAVMAAAQKYGITAVATTSTDVGVPTLGVVVDALNLKGPTYKMARTVSSKTAFRTFQKENGLNHPDFATCSDAKSAWMFCQHKNCTVVIKPDDSSGSRGVSILKPGLSEIAIAKEFYEAVRYSKAGTVCIEECIPGREIGGDAFIRGGEFGFYTATSKHMKGLLVEGHSIPSNLNDKETGLAKDEIRKTLDALGYEDGPLNFDIMLDEGGATILEMGLRSGGNGIVDLIKHSYGVDLMELLLAYVLDEPAPLSPNQQVKSASSFVFGTAKRGYLSYVSSLAELREAVPQVFYLVLAKKPGERVDPLIHNANQIGYVLINCGAEEYQGIVSKIRKALRLEVES